jgi:four helix bundle protein
MRDHTSLEAWREAEAVSLSILSLSRTHWKPYAQAVFNQVQRSSISVATNISEGYSFTNSPSFHRHLRIAYGSAVETGDLLNLLSKASVVPPELVEPILSRCRRSQRLLLGLIKRYAENGMTRPSDERKGSNPS